MRIEKSNNEFGYSLTEVMVALMILGIILASASVDFKTLERPLVSSGEQIVGFFRVARASAISNTMSRVVYADGASLIRVKEGTSCTEALSGSNIVSDLQLELPYGVHFTSSNWEVCISPRGFFDSSSVIQVQDFDGKSISIETYLGGTARYVT